MNKFILIIICALLGVNTAFSNNDSNKKKNNMDKTLTVKELKFNNNQPSIAEIDKALDAANIEFNNIDCVNWKKYTYMPEVKFRIAYSPSEIYLQYVVKEDDIKAVFGKDSGSEPFKDSCVEFFIIPANDGIYYNLEMNCIAIGTFAGGKERNNRTKFGDDVLKQIRRESTLGNTPMGIKTKADNNGEPYTWKITIALPVNLFSLSNTEPLKGRTVKANFYKCGDEMPNMQFQSWNPIGNPTPNFHLPEYFGNIKFE